MHPHSALDPSFLGSFKRLFAHSGGGGAQGCYLDIDMTRRVDWYAYAYAAQRSSSPPGRAFLDQPATSPPTCELSVLVPELRALVLQAIASSASVESRATTLGSEICSEEPGGGEREREREEAGRKDESGGQTRRTGTGARTGAGTGSRGNVDKDIWTLHIRQTRFVTVRDVLAALDRFLYAEVPASYWPEDPRLQERIECAHRLRVKHLARTHGRSARAGARMSMSIMHGKGGAGFGVGGGGHLAPLCFMQVVECAEVDAHGRMVKRDRKVAPRIDWLGGKFFFAGLKKSREAEVDFVLNMEAPWARRRRSLT
ncbi:hypothetical protein ACEPAG_9679 [Sanghuangporus baumii]